MVICRRTHSKVSMAFYGHFTILVKWFHSKLLTFRANEKMMTALRAKRFISLMQFVSFFPPIISRSRWPSGVLSLHLFGTLSASLSGIFLLPSPNQSICCSVQAVLSAHDTVAQKNFDPVLPPLPEELDDDFEEESVKIVRLVKNKEPLVRKNMMTFILLSFFFSSVRTKVRKNHWWKHQWGWCRLTDLGCFPLVLLLDAKQS